MTKSKSYSLLGVTLVAGMSVFSMFFGSGNLVFPLSIGINSGQHLYMGILGLVITGVIVPFLGLYGIIMYNGDKKKYFATVHPHFPKIITTLILALLGPFGVVPRCIVVAYGGINLVFPNLQIWIFSGIFCFLAFFMIKTKKRIIEIIGKYLTPILLFGVFAITVCGVFYDSEIPNVQSESSSKVFFSSLLTGYNTMDLLAAFFFGVTIKQYLNSVLEDHKIPRSHKLSSLGTCTIAAILLTLVYIGFIIIGNKYSRELTHTAPESYLAHIADITLGGYSKYIAAITIALACFTTAIILIRLFADFIEETVFKNGAHKIFNSKIITLGISFILSMIGFKKITMFLGGILSFLYPALIAVALGNIIEKVFKIKITAILFWTALLGNVILSCCF